MYVAGVRCQDVDTASFTWAGDQAPTPATVGPTADGDLPRSVLNDVPRASLDNAGWTNVLSTTYGTITTWDDTDFSAHGNVCLMVGCRHSSDSVYYTAAFGSAASISQSSPLNTPHLVRGVYWYRTFDKSFGYAPTYVVAACSLVCGFVMLAMLRYFQERNYAKQRGHDCKRRSEEAELASEWGWRLALRRCHRLVRCYRCGHACGVLDLCLAWQQEYRLDLRERSVEGARRCHM